MLNFLLYIIVKRWDLNKVFILSCLVYDFHIKRLYLKLFVGVFMCYLRYLCTLWCPTHIVLCFCIVFLRLVYPMLPVSLDCPFLIAPSVFSNVYFLIFHYLTFSYTEHVLFDNTFNIPTVVICMYMVEWILNFLTHLNFSRQLKFRIYGTFDRNWQVHRVET